MPAAIVARDDDPTSAILQLDAFPDSGTPLHQKKGGYDFFAAIGSPKHIVAPMVDQSELQWRILSRRYDSHLVYTPMINARSYLSKVKATGPKNLSQFWIADDSSKQEEGQSSITKASADEIGSDRPLIVQFAGHDCDVLLEAARCVEEHCDAVDLNLGCPQDIARRGHYGSFLQSDWQLIYKLINILHINLKIPVTAKMRVFESVERTVAYARMMEKAGAQIITVHGRTREMKGHNTGLADWKKIKAVKEAVRVPVFANGNVLYHGDVEKALKATGADGIMSAEGNLYNPTMFALPPTEPSELFPLAPIYPFPRIAMLIQEYLTICDQIDTPASSSSIKSHLFKLAKPALEVHRELRPVLGQCAVSSKAGEGRYVQFHHFLIRLAEKLKADETNDQYTQRLSTIPVQFESKEGEDPQYIPHWLAQPCYRKTLPPPDEPMEAKEARLEQRAQRVGQTEGTVCIDDVQTRGEEVIQGKGENLVNLIQEAKRLKDIGNKQYERKEYEDAILQYTEVLTVLPSRPPRRTPKSRDAVIDNETPEETSSGEDEEEEESKVIQTDDVKALLDEARILRSVVYSNLAACHMAKKEFKEAVVACNEALLDDPLYLKALNRRAQANEEIGSWSSLTSALEDIKRINSMPHPASLQTSLNAALSRLPNKIAITSEKEKEEMLGKLKGIGDSVLGYFGLSTNNFQMQKGEGGGYSLNFVK